LKNGYKTPSAPCPYNRYNRNLIRSRLIKESKLIAKESILVLSEFEAMKDENKAN
jgi:hypothetical protein